MSVLDRVLSELDESYIIENITKKHDEARIQYQSCQGKQEKTQGKLRQTIKVS